MLDNIRDVAHSWWPHRVLPLCSLFLMVMAVAFLWYDGAHRLYVPRDFSYSIDIISSDNLYSPEHQRYEGARYTKGTVSYSVVDDSNPPTVRNVLQSIDIRGNIVANISRTRQVDAQSGKYLTKANDSSDPGYLFAPRNLAKGQSFTYRHVTYDTPAHMKYVGEDTIADVPVYHYRASFNADTLIKQEDVKAEGIGANQGLAYQPTLDVWVEPVTGWLVNYRDDSTVVVYDKESGKTVRPYDRFSGRMSEESVLQQVAYARGLKYQLTFGNQIAPGIMMFLVLIGVAAIWSARLKAQSISVYISLLAIGGLSALALVGWFLRSEPMVRLFVDGSGLNPLAVVLFLLAAAVLFVLYRQFDRRWAVVGAAIISVFAFLQLLGASGSVPFAVDLAVFGDRVQAMSSSHPARISLFGAFAFLALGVGLLLSGLPRVMRHHSSIPAFLAGTVGALGVIGICLQFLQLDKTFTLPFIYSLSLATSVLLALCGFVWMQILQQQKGATNSLRSTIMAFRWPALATLPILILCIFAQYQQNLVKQKLEALFEQRTTQLASQITLQARTYGSVTAGASGLLAASDFVTQNEWARYANALRTTGDYPNPDVLAYGQFIKDTDVPALERQQRAVGSADFAAFPSARGRESVVLLYALPDSDNNRKLKGYDLMTDAQLTEAMDRARDDAATSISDTLRPNAAATLAEDAGRFAIFSPVYRADASLGTVEERRAALQGYALSVIGVGSFMDGALQGIDNSLNVIMYDGSDNSPTTQIYRRYAEASNQAPRLAKTHTIYAQNHAWTITYEARDSFRLDAWQENLPSTIFIGGSAAYFALLGLGYVQYGNRRKALFVNQLVLRTAHDLADQVDDFFHESLLEQNKLAIKPQPFLLAGWLHDVEHVFADIVEAKRARFHTSLDAGLPAEITLDKNILQLLVHNLLSNAFKYSPTGATILLSIEKASTLDMQEHNIAEHYRGALLIRVSDTGYGIPAAQQKFVFSKSFRASSNLTAQEEGTGLGLYLVKELSERVHGAAWFVSEEGSGSTFYLIVPYE